MSVLLATHFGVTLKQHQRAGCWVHVFRRDTFGGRLRQLSPGDREAVGKVGSVIVGPGARASIIDRNSREITGLPPRKVIGDFSNLDLKKRASHIRAEKA